MSGPAPADPTRFRALMGRWATGVSVVTATADGADAGLTVNSLASISLAPPTVLVSLTQDADTLAVIARSGGFAVSFLAADQRALSERFARTIPAAEKFAGVGVHRGPRGAPILDGHVGALECRVTERRAVHDHALVLGEVHHVETGRDALPLVFFRSGYAEADGPDRLRLPLPRG
ncbi:MAG TPA: flavin reductase family protein [Thermoplasmata archaeon]|nr:flavin reductase family protein [Thermoplasmata archaeon]